MTGRRVLVLLPLAAVLLAGCGTDPADERRAHVADITEAANSGDEHGVRSGADALLRTVVAQLERAEVSQEEADRLTALAESVRRGADVIDEDLLERRRAEAEAEAARRAAEEAQKRLEEERRRAEEERDKDGGKGEGKGKDEDKDD